VLKVWEQKRPELGEESQEPGAWRLKRPLQGQVRVPVQQAPGVASKQPEPAEEAQKEQELEEEVSLLRGRHHPISEWKAIQRLECCATSWEAD
jgi:hypothetical protein